MANNNGVVVFDGASWEVLPTPKPARSVAIDALNRIYVGCVGDLGWIVLKDDNRLHYESLLDRLPKESRDFKEVTKVYADTLGAYYVTERSILYVSARGGDWREVRLPSGLNGTAKAGKKLFVCTLKHGLLELENGNTRNLDKSEEFSGKNLLSAFDKGNGETVFNFADESMFVYKSSGFAKLNAVAVTAFGKTYQTVEAIGLKEGGWLQGTMKGGVAIVSANETIRNLLNKKSGLPDDNIYSVFQDRSGSLWIAHNKGLSLYRPSAPVRIYGKEQGLSGEIKDIRLHKGILYVATIQGVYAKNDKSFIPIPGIENECWQLDVVADKLVVATNDGLYELTATKARRVLAETYCVSVVGAAAGKAGWLASDAGVTPITVKGNSFSIGTPLNIPTQNFTILRKAQNGELLILTPDKGMFLYAGQGQDVQSLNTLSGLPAGPMDALGFDNGVLASSNKSLFVGSSLGEKVAKVESKIFDGTLDYALLANDAGTAVVGHGSQVALVAIKGKGIDAALPSWANLAQRKSSVAYLSGKTLYLGVRDQLYHITDLEQLQPMDEQVIIRNVRKANNDSVLVSGRQPNGLAGFKYETPAKKTTLSRVDNSITIEYALPDFVQSSANSYRYRLVGLDSTWSSWTTKTTVSYSSLPPGDFVFEVQGRNALLQAAVPASLQFTVERPVWLAPWAYAVYVLLALGFMYMGARMYSRRIELRAANLEAIVNERTREVNKQKEQIEAQVKELNQKNQTLDEAFKELNDKNVTLDKAYNELNEKNTSLDRALRDLKDTQDQLVQNEKMASLGQLVAGVAHEINTPVGIGVTAASNLDFKAKEFARKVESGQVRKTDFDGFVKNALESSDIILINLKRAAELIQSFKKVAVDQSYDELRPVNLYSYIEEVLFSLSPQFKTYNIHIAVEGNKDFEFATYPSGLSQIIINLTMNTLVHAFDEGQTGEIKIRFAPEGEKLKLIFSDNGKGIKPDILPKIFDPFFTTNRSKGGSGLGLNIVYNLVSNKMKGAIRAESELGKGTTFFIELPITAA